MRGTLVVAGILVLALGSHDRLAGQQIDRLPRQAPSDSIRTLLVVADSLQLLLPTVVNGVRRLTDKLRYEPLFDRVDDASQMESAYLLLTPLRELLRDLSSGDPPFDRAPFPDAVSGTITEAEELLYVRVTRVGEVHEFQLTHFRVSPSVADTSEAEATAMVEIPLADLTRPVRSASVIIDVQSADYERRLTRALVELFPESNTPPTARIHVDGSPLDPDTPRYVFTGDTVRLDARTSLDSDTPFEELSFLWTVEGEASFPLERRSAAQSIVLPPGRFKLTLRVSDGFEKSYGEAHGQIESVPRPGARLSRRSLNLNATRSLFGAWSQRHAGSGGENFEEAVDVEVQQFEPRTDTVCVRVGGRGETSCGSELMDREGRIVGQVDRNESADSGGPHTIRIADRPSRTDTLHVTVTRRGLTVLRDSVVVRVYREPTMIFRLWIGAAISTIETVEAPEGGDYEYGVSVGAGLVIRPVKEVYLDIGIIQTPSLESYELGLALGAGVWLGGGRLRPRVGAKFVLVPDLVSTMVDGSSEYLGLTGGAMWALTESQRFLALMAEAGLLVGSRGAGFGVEGTVFEANIGLALAF